MTIIEKTWNSLVPGKLYSFYLKPEDMREQDQHFYSRGYSLYSWEGLFEHLKKRW